MVQIERQGAGQAHSDSDDEIAGKHACHGDTDREQGLGLPHGPDLLHLLHVNLFVVGGTKRRLVSPAAVTIRQEDTAARVPFAC
jgi:hypothetical protein